MSLIVRNSDSSSASQVPRHFQPKPEHSCPSKARGEKCRLIFVLEPAAAVSKKASIREQKEAARQETRRKAREKARGGPRKGIGAILSLSLATGGLTALSFYATLNAAPNIGIVIDPQLQQLIVILAFAISFLLAFLVFINKHHSFAELSERRKSKKSKDQIKAPKQKFGGTLAVKGLRYEKVFDSETARKVAAPASLDDGAAFDVKAEPNSSTDTLGQTASPSKPNPDAATEGPDDNPDRFVAQDRLEIVLDDLKRAMMAVSTMLNGRSMPLDDFARFGLNLIFAGICACLTKKYTLEATEGQGLLSRLMELTGSDSDAAKRFSDNINTYGEVEVFRGMIDSGGALMTEMLESPDGDGSGMSYAFGALLHDWESAENPPALPSESVFLFTEIVGFSGLVDELDNAAIKRVVSQHDGAVRDALSRFSGEEVQHTGEGILARFDDARAAIDGAVDMIQNTDLFSRQNPEVGFDMRTGIHIGEAVEDGGRFVGNTVKTAALVCNEAGGSEIWVSSDVWSACPAYADDLRYCGEFVLEELGESKELYMMLWEPLVDPKNAKVDYKDIGKRK